MLGAPAAGARVRTGEIAADHDAVAVTLEGETERLVAFACGGEVEIEGDDLRARGGETFQDQRVHFPRPRPVIAHQLQRARRSRV